MINPHSRFPTTTNGRFGRKQLTVRRHGFAVRRSCGFNGAFDRFLVLERIRRTPSKVNAGLFMTAMVVARASKYMLDHGMVRVWPEFPRFVNEYEEGYCHG